MPKPATAAQYVAQVDAPLRPLFRAVRAFVRKHAPDLDERLYMGVPSYFGDGQVFYILEYSKHVNLGFVRGATLADPDGLLQGTGKGLRHAKVRSKDDLSPALARLIAKASQVSGPRPAASRGARGPRPTPRRRS